MYTVQNLAFRLGITPKQARKWLRSLGGYSTGVRYEFNHREYEALVAQYNGSAHTSNDEDPSAPGLPIAALYDRSARDRFYTLRAQRLARLEAQLHASGMALGQLDPRALINTGRMDSLKDY